MRRSALARNGQVVLRDVQGHMLEWRVGFDEQLGVVVTDEHGATWSEASGCDV